MPERRTSYLQGFKLYPLSVAGHVAQGVMVALGVVFLGVPGIVLGVIWTALYIAYQGLSVLRKEDSPGLDIADFMTGVAIGVVIVIVIGFAKG